MNEDAKTWIVQLATIALCFVAILALIFFVMSKAFMTPEDKINSMTPPITIIAISATGDVVLTDGIGEMLVLPSDYYLAQALSHTFKPGHILLKD